MTANWEAQFQRVVDLIYAPEDGLPFGLSSGLAQNLLGMVVQAALILFFINLIAQSRERSLLRRNRRQLARQSRDDLILLAQQEDHSAQVEIARRIVRRIERMEQSLSPEIRNEAIQFSESLEDSVGDGLTARERAEISETFLRFARSLGISGRDLAIYVHLIKGFYIERRLAA